MEKLNELMFLAENDEEFNSFLQKNIDDYIDVISYLKILKTSNSEKLLNLIVSKLEFLDSKNIAINFSEIKTRLGLNGKFVIDVKSLDEKNNSIELNENLITLSNLQANQICGQIHDELLKYIIEQYGEIEF